MSCSRRLGNTYTGSLYGCLASLLSNVEPTQLQGKRVIMSLFSFGSGFASSFFTLRVRGDTSEISRTMNLLERLSSMKVVLLGSSSRLWRYVVFISFCTILYCVRLRFIFLQLREKNHNAVNYTPEGLVENIWPGSYYLESVDPSTGENMLELLSELEKFLVDFDK